MSSRQRARNRGTCPICGWELRSGSCPQCNANAFGRDRRWRRGDKGGKRPERRTVRRALRGALDGTWYNYHHDVSLVIDTELNSYRSKHGSRPASQHRFRLDAEESDGLRFFKDDLPIKAHIDRQGFLQLAAAGKQMAFLYVYDDERFLTCPACYAKSPVEHAACHECRRRL